MKAERCPICFGKGTVPHGFYEHGNSYRDTTTVMTPEPCRSCHGRGIVFVPNDIETPEQFVRRTFADIRKHAPRSADLERWARTFTSKLTQRDGL
jgi:hypothetical protein